MLDVHEPVEPLLADLDEAQRAAVLATEGPVLVLAGAGSGKTRVITYRIAYILASGRAGPGEILALTFTNKAAREMKDRVERLTGLPSRDLWITTFHSFGARILRRHAGLVGLGQAFAIYDDDDSARLVKRLFKEQGLTDGRLTPSGFLSWLETEDPSASEGASYLHRRYSEFFQTYRGELRRSNAVDFADLLRVPLGLLGEHPEVLAHYQERFRYVLVDEYQDTNRPQYHLARMLSGRHGNLCAVGDEDQSIYSWRGADIRNILDFERDVQGPIQVFNLATNYRSQSYVLRAAASVIVNNRLTRKKTAPLVAGRPAGERVTLHIAGDASQEAEHVARSIGSLLAGGVPPAAIAVLYRTHAQARTIEERVTAARIPYRVFGGVPFFSKKEVKDLLAYLFVLANPADEGNLRRAVLVPRRGIGEKTIDAATERAHARGTTLMEILRSGEGLPAAQRRRVAEFLGVLAQVAQREAEGLHAMAIHLVDTIGYRQAMAAEGREDREDIVDELLNLLFEFDQARSAVESPVGPGPLVAFLEGVSLYATTDDLDRSHGTVTLMTLHNAKGLEFDHVLIVGLEDGLFPHESATDPLALEEERRLLYVGMTRARERLTLTAARMRTVRGELRYRTPSRFLLEIDPDCLRVPGAAGAWRPDHETF